ncbi:MAG: HutD family protein [Alsobacter sp.]
MTEAGPGWRILRAADQVETPWKNGGGVTAEIAAAPPGAGLDAFDWRISRATVAADGPFSAFPEIDRTLTVLDGDGLLLAVGDAPSALLSADGDPFAFPGDVPAHGRLVGGAVVDLNVMTRRGRVAHAVARLAAGATLPPLQPGETAVLVCTRPGLRLQGPGAPSALALHDALRIDGPVPPWRVDGPGLLVVLTPASTSA